MLCSDNLSLYPDENEKDKSLKKMSDRFQILLTPKILKFWLCF